MPRRNVAASWTFYASGEPPVYSNIKPYFTVAGEQLVLHPIPNPATREAIAAHHANDYFMHNGWTTQGFPNVIQVARAIYGTVTRSIEYRLLTDAFWDTNHSSGSGVLARRLLDELIRTARRRNTHVVFVLMQIVDRLSEDTPHYDQIADELRRRGDVCVIDTRPSLRAQVQMVGVKALSAPEKHYNALGNRVIAEEIAAGLTRCGIKLG
jgi:hypothetical protein